MQHEIRRWRFAGQIRRGCFRSSEQEYDLLEQLLREGDWAIDVGANVGHYTSKMSQLVGHTGRVIAFEPVPDTFELLAANARSYEYQNVTLFNAAAGERSEVHGFRIPGWTYGAPNYYRAHLDDADPAFHVFFCSIDSLHLPNVVALIKIDVEGATEAVLRGAGKLIERDCPTLVIEGEPDSILPLLRVSGYRLWRYPGSPNVILRAGETALAGAELPVDYGPVEVSS